jgi:hypothetical protein
MVRACQRRSISIGFGAPLALCDQRILHASTVIAKVQRV